MSYTNEVNRKVQLYAVVRYNEGREEIRNRVTIVAVVPTSAEAQQEVARLTDLRRSEGATYFWTVARYYPDGRNAGPEAN